MPASDPSSFWSLMEKVSRSSHFPFSQRMIKWYSFRSVGPLLPVSIPLSASPFRFNTGNKTTFTFADLSRQRLLHMYPSVNLGIRSDSSTRESFSVRMYLMRCSSCFVSNSLPSISSNRACLVPSPTLPFFGGLDFLCTVCCAALFFFCCAKDGVICVCCSCSCCGVTEKEENDRCCTHSCCG